MDRRTKEKLIEILFESSGILNDYVDVLTNFGLDINKEPHKALDRAGSGIIEAVLLICDVDSNDDDSDYIIDALAAREKDSHEMARHIIERYLSED